MITKAKKDKIWIIGLPICLLISCMDGSLFQKSEAQLLPIPADSWIDDASRYKLPEGSGTESVPYLITCPEELAYFAKTPPNTGKLYLNLMQNIDLADHLWVPIDAPDASFVINGNNYSIQNMKIRRSGKENNGFLGRVYSIRINYVNFSNIDVVGGDCTGGILGYGNYELFASSITVSGKVYGANQVGGFYGFGRYSNITESTNNASVIATGDCIGGFIGKGDSGNIDKTFNFGNVMGNTYVGGIVGSFASPLAIYHTISQNTVCGKDYIGGLAGKCERVGNSFFQGSIIVTGDAPTNISLFVCEGSIIWDSFIHSIINSFAIGEIVMQEATSTESVSIFGAGNEYNYTSSYVDYRITTKSTFVERRKWMKSSAETEPFADWSYSPYINGGYPFPKGMFAVGAFIDNVNVLDFLNLNGFDSRLPLEIKTLENSTYGTDKYVEFGKYPQTYVGASMNTTLENWYSGKMVVDTYTVDNGTSATSNVYNAYTYTDGKTYVRIPTPKPYNTSANTGKSIYSDGTEVSLKATWFEVQPIRWLILNYADVQNGASPVVVAEQALFGNTPWNKTNDDQNLWSKTCNIRTWLNGTFYNETFGSDEKGNIVNTTVLNNSQSSDTDGTGTSTTDNVWLLSYDEVNGKYFTTSTQRIASPTDFALANYCKLYTSTSYSTTARPNGGTCYFWLRSAYPSNTVSARVVYYSSYVSSDNVDIPFYAVRPALTLNI